MIDLHFHIGLHKTGTTYLQTGLVRNRAALAARGVHLVDKPTSYPGDHALWLLLRREGPIAFAGTLAAAAAAKDARAMMVSSEQFGLHLRDPEAARSLAAALAPAFRTRVYIWLRRQDTLRESVYSQSVKRVAVGGIRDKLWYGYDFDAWLRTIEDAFGRDALTVRLYHDRRRDDVLSEFLALAGIDLPDLDRPQEVNVSPSRRETLFMAGVSKASVARAATIMRCVQADRCIADDGLRTLLSPAERRDFLAGHLEGNRRLADRHDFPPEDRDWLTSLPPQDPEWFPPAPISAAERRAVWRACMGRTLGGGGRSFGLWPALRLAATLASRPVAAPPGAGTL